jgi:hypothetical protein
MAKRASFGPLVLVLAAASCSLYVACGDDDYILPPANGGSAGSGGGAGSGSLAGSGGQGGSSGSGTTDGGSPDASPNDAAVVDDSGTSNGDGG